MDRSLGDNPKILVVLLGALGDVVRGLSLLPRLYQHYPKAEVTWLVEPKSAGILENHPLIKRIIVFNREHPLQGVWQLRKQLKQYEFDICLDLQRHFKSGVFSGLARARRKIGFSAADAKEFNWLFSTEKIEKFGSTVPKILAYQGFLDLLGLPAWDKRAGGLDHFKHNPDRSNQISIVFVLGSSWPSKNWLKEGYVGLAQLIKLKLSHKIVLVGGSSERELAEELVQQFGPDRLKNLVGQTSLVELARVIASASVVVGPDSGPGHIAAALEVPYISLFGPTDPARVAPWGMEQYVLRSAVPCSPCQRRRCPGLGGVCMRLLHPEPVFQMMNQVLERRLGQQLA